LETSYFDRCILNVHKSGIVLYISVKITLSWWFCFVVRMCNNFRQIWQAFALGVWLLSRHNFFTFSFTVTLII